MGKDQKLWVGVAGTFDLHKGRAQKKCVEQNDVAHFFRNGRGLHHEKEESHAVVHCPH